MQPGRPALVHEVRIREGNNGYLGVICDAISLCSEIEHIEHGSLHRILCYRVWAQSCTQTRRKRETFVSSNAFLSSPHSHQNLSTSQE
ncbi:hypothetical protein C4D60_Mb01t29730 [Musa balbisiana]|uniref:Uncharacterized protein n=1 Tax=Musa balbisiana TaxID=52838 RepID=A0A4S8JRP6_MUSBA|nr:hypothetical protein C4D60_Mb01t29730 [Musa balbisiana]